MGLIISTVFFHKDIREEGSGNIGTTNAMRTMGKAGGAAVFVLDFGKGLLVGGSRPLVRPGICVPGGRLSPECLVQLRDRDLGLAFLGCVWGHIFSPWLKFKGGKGIAVAVGCLFVTFGPVGACSSSRCSPSVVAMTRYVSVGSIAAAAVCPFFSLYFFWGEWVAWASARWPA